MASRGSEAKKPTTDYSRERKLRPCLMCGTRFTSTHFGERVCPSCKGTSAWREGVNPA